MIRNISATALALLVLTGCNQDDTINEVPEYGYIFFDTEVASRATLIEERLEASFGVLGYTYNSDWNTAKAQATPNVFTNQKVEWDATNEVHDYFIDAARTQKQTWTGTQNHSFFAYYPYSGDNSNVVPSGSTVEGNPYIDYTLPSRSDAKALVDVMTSQLIDTSVNDGNVGLVMKHRLSAIDVVARNVKPSAITISDVSVTFDNLHFDKVRIPLNYQDEPDLVYTEEATTKTAIYPLTTAGSSISVAANDAAAISSDNQTTMIVIPQAGDINLDDEEDIEITEQNCHLKGSISFKYNGSTELTTLSFTFEKGVMPGRRYYIQLTFTESAVTIAVVETEEWRDLDDIYHEFE